jgi:hypothetical protein
VRIRIALSTTFAVTCMITAFLISLGSTSSASAPTVPVAASEALPVSSAAGASLAVPVLVHAALGLVIAAGHGQFPAGGGGSGNPARGPGGADRRHQCRHRRLAVHPRP